MNTKKIILILLAVILLGGAYAWFFVYNKPHTDFQAEDAAFIGLADELHAKALENENLFNEAFLNEAVEVEGVITEAGTNSFTLSNGIVCTLDPNIEQNIPEFGQDVKVKGRVVGTEDDILTGELICNLDQCVIITD